MSRGTDVVAEPCVASRFKRIAKESVRLLAGLRREGMLCVWMKRPESLGMAE